MKEEKELSTDYCSKCMNKAWSTVTSSGMILCKCQSCKFSWILNCSHPHKVKYLTAFGKWAKAKLKTIINL